MSPERWGPGVAGATTGDAGDYLHLILLQGSSSPARPTSSACCGRRFTPIWS